MDDLRLITRRNACKDFYEQGAKCFDGWKGVPTTNIRMRPIITCMEDEFGGINEMKYRIVELGPNGGRWTYTVLSILQHCGFPVELEYFLLGSKSEHALTKRDCLTPTLFPTPISYNKPARIRTGGSCPRLFSEVRFTPVKSDWYRAVDESNKAFTPRIDTFIAYDSIRYLDPNHLYDVVKSIAHCIVLSSGTFFTNIENIYCKEFEALCKASGFVERIDPVSYDGCLYYCLRKR